MTHKSIAFGKWECTRCGDVIEHIGNAPIKCKKCPTKIVCNQCRLCAVENKTVLDCADDDCRCHTLKEIAPDRLGLDKKFHANFASGSFGLTNLQYNTLYDFMEEFLKEERGCIIAVIEGLLSKEDQMLGLIAPGNTPDNAYTNGRKSALKDIISHLHQI